MSSEPLPTDRYPDRRRSGGPRARRTWWIVAGLVAAVAITFVAFLRIDASAPVSVESAGYSVIDDRTTDVTIIVSRDDASQPVDCIVKARSRDGSEVGRREVLVPAGESRVTVTTRVHTSQRAGMGDAYGCSATVPDYLRPAERE